MKQRITLFWWRRDLRIDDNAGLFYALKAPFPVQPVFIFDTNILGLLPKHDARVTFIHGEIMRLQAALTAQGATLDVRVGQPLEVWQKLVEDYDVALVYTNDDYEPYARQRDRAVFELLHSRGIPFIAKKDHVIFEKDEILKPTNRSPYTVFTPYSKVWKKQLTPFHYKSYPSEHIHHFLATEEKPIPSLQQIGFLPTAMPFPSREWNEEVIKQYEHTREQPARQGTSRLGLHLRFGTVSIRALVAKALSWNETYLNQLIWRDFFHAILWHFPRVVQEHFNKKYDHMLWRHHEEEFEKWKQGKTGYPIVDAGMRELNQTGFMHNRVRMITACFLSKHLLIDWRWGAAYFAEKLLDYDLASNNGGWQWAAGTGTDAQPYFRIFNPYTQASKFDKDQKYVRKWVEAYGTRQYPQPMVDHAYARVRCLKAYQSSLPR